MEIKKIWLLPLIVVAVFVFNPVLAQESLPEPGSGFESAPLLSLGTYAGENIGNALNITPGAITESSFSPQKSGTYYAKMAIGGIEGAKR